MNDVGRFGNCWQICTAVEKALRPRPKMTGACEPVKCHDAKLGELETHAKVSCVTRL